MGDHDFCLSQSHYTVTDPNSGEQAQGSNPRLTDQELPRTQNFQGGSDENNIDQFVVWVYQGSIFSTLIQSCPSPGIIL